MNPHVENVAVMAMIKCARNPEGTSACREPRNGHFRTCFSSIPMGKHRPTDSCVPGHTWLDGIPVVYIFTRFNVVINRQTTWEKVVHPAFLYPPCPSFAK